MSVTCNNCCDTSQGCFYACLYKQRGLVSGKHEGCMLPAISSMCVLLLLCMCPNDVSNVMFMPPAFTLFAVLLLCMFWYDMLYDMLYSQMVMVRYLLMISTSVFQGWQYATQSHGRPDRIIAFCFVAGFSLYDFSLSPFSLSWRIGTVNIHDVTDMLPNINLWATSAHQRCESASYAAFLHLEGRCLSIAL